MFLSNLILIPAAFAAGIIASLAGGGPFLTFPALLLTGLDPRAANITSTVGLYPMQVSIGFKGRKVASGTKHLSFTALVVISLVGGMMGAVLLMSTSPTFFARFVPWLILFATGVFAWGSFRKKPSPLEARRPHRDHLGKFGAAATQFLISLYGGYFGGGIGLLMLAILTGAGMSMRQAGNTKNILTAVINTSAAGVFLMTPDIHWFRAAIVAVSATSGGLLGVQMLNRFDERWLRILVVAIGVALTITMFIRAPH